MAGERLDKVSGNIVFKNVHFAYPTRAEKPILKGLNLHIEAGKTVALVGPSGGGKSTVMAMLQRLYDPTSGSVELDGQPLSAYDGCIVSLPRHHMAQTERAVAAR